MLVSTNRHTLIVGLIRIRPQATPQRDQRPSKQECTRVTLGRNSSPFAIDYGGLKELAIYDRIQDLHPG